MEDLYFWILGQEQNQEVEEEERVPVKWAAFQRNVREQAAKDSEYVMALTGEETEINLE